MQREILPNEQLLGEVVTLLNEGLEVVLRVKGQSMLPFVIGDRDSVILRKVSPLKRHDIVLAHLPNGHYVLHRIIRIHGERLTLMGDGNLRATESCLQEEVAGKVIRIQREAREYPIDSCLMQWKVKIWIALRPIRRYLLAVWRRLPR